VWGGGGDIFSDLFGGNCCFYYQEGLTDIIWLFRVHENMGSSTIGQVSILANVYSGKCPFGQMFVRENVHCGKCLSCKCRNTENMVSKYK